MNRSPASSPRLRPRLRRLSGILTLLGLGRLASWLTGDRPRRSPVAGTPAIDAIGRAFDIGVAAPLLGLLRLSQGFRGSVRGESRAPEPDWSDPTFDFESLLQSAAEKVVRNPPSAPRPSAPGPPRDLEAIRTPDFGGIFGPSMDSGS